MHDPAIGFIGAGALGNGLALSLSAKGYRVAAVASRTLSSAEGLAGRIAGCEAASTPQEVADLCQVVFITTPDEVISQVAASVTWRRGQGVVHCSGAASLAVLEPAARLGSDTGSFHPFQTFACLESPQQAMERLSGITFAIEGRGWLLDLLREMATKLGGMAIALRPEERAIYHASAVMSCGYLVALLKAAADMWQEMGVPTERALPIILPLARSTLANLSRAGMDAATGPLVRGDTATVERHLEALEARLPRLAPLYCYLARESLPLARGKVGAANLDAMEQLIADHLTPSVGRGDG